MAVVEDEPGIAAGVYQGTESDRLGGKTEEFGAGEARAYTSFGLHKAEPKNFEKGNANGGCAVILMVEVTEIYSFFPPTSVPQRRSGIALLPDGAMLLFTPICC